MAHRRPGRGGANPVVTHDRRPGPSPGLGPGRRALAGVWVAASVILGLLLWLTEPLGGPLDDPDPARQRPGFLDGFGLPLPAPSLGGGLPAHGRPTVVFFERPGRVDRLCDALGSSDLGRLAAVAIAVRPPDGRCPTAALVADPVGDVARSYGMRQPVDGGPPVGYAVVDQRGRIRYRTLDPSSAEGLSEVRTMVEALE